MCRTLVPLGSMNNILLKRSSCCGASSCAKESNVQEGGSIHECTCDAINEYMLLVR